MNLNLIRNALMLGTLCGAVMGFFKYTWVTRRADTNFQRVMLVATVLLLFPFCFSMATAIVGTFAIGAARWLFVVSCGLLSIMVLVAFITILILGWPPPAGANAEVANGGN